MGQTQVIVMLFKFNCLNNYCTCNWADIDTVIDFTLVDRLWPDT